MLLNILVTQSHEYGVPETGQYYRFVAPVSVITPTVRDYETYETSITRWYRDSPVSCGSASLLHQVATLKNGRKGSVSSSYESHFNLPVRSQSAGIMVGPNEKWALWRCDGKTLTFLDADRYDRSVQWRAYQWSSFESFRDIQAGAMYTIRCEEKQVNFYMYSPSSIDRLNTGEIFARANSLLDQTYSRYVSRSDYADITHLSPLGDLLSFDNEAQEAFDNFQITGGIGPNHRACLASAYSNAVQSLPQVQANMIMNVIELAGSVKSLLEGDFGKALSSADAWLKYRYVYNTTKADLNDIMSFTSRISNFASCPMVRSYGDYHYNGYHYRCSLTYRTSDLVPKNLREYFRKWGFKLSAYNVWDMIPFSFIADWFLHISDFLKYIETVSDMVRIPVTSVWYSISNTTDMGEVLCENYLRLRGTGANLCLPKLDINWSWSGRALTSRLADVGAIFFGK